MVAEVTDIRIYKLKDSEKMKAFAAITLDDEFVIHGIKVMENENGPWVSFPAKKDGSGEFRDIFHPVTKEARERVISAVLGAYESEVSM